PRRTVRLLAGVVLIALLLFAGIWPRVGRSREAVAIANSAESALPAVVVNTAKVTSGGADVILPGNTEAINVASIYARSNGYIRQRTVDIGSAVRSGQVLAVIESPEVDQELAQG